MDIGLLLRRHKSWVSRRIALVEKLSGEVLTHLKLGLISAGHGRELTRLPHGNQERALATVLKHRLSCRETDRLASMLLERPRWEHEAILNLPLEILEDRSAPRTKADCQPSLTQRFNDFKQICHDLALALDACDLEPLNSEERESALPVSQELEILLDRVRRALNA